MLTARLRHQIYLLVRPARAQPDYRAGLRAALSTAVPLLAASILHPASATWASLAGFSVALADKGGAYRTRAIATGALAITGALAAILGGLAGSHAWVAVLLVALWSAGATLARVLGSSAMSVGISSTIILIISVAAPAHSLGDALSRAGAILVGSAWAMLLSLGFWPLRPYRPLRLAISRLYSEVAHQADLVASVAGADGDVTDAMAFDHERRHLRTLIEAAREQLVRFRRGGPAGSERGERMLVLVELADQLLGLSAASADLFESAAARPPGSPTAHPHLEQALRLVGNLARESAELVLLEKAPDEAIRERGATLAALTSSVPLAGDIAHDEYSLLAARLVATAHAAFDTAAHLEVPEGPGAHPDVIAPYSAPSSPSPMALLRASIGRQSLTLQHALRVGIMMAVAVALTHVLPLGRGYWLTITVLLVLQPETGTTVIRTSQRVLGTLIGALITALVAMTIPGAGTATTLVILLIFACVSLLPINYLLYTAVMTPAFVLLAELSAGDWHLAGLRVENTLIGGALALIGARLLWPASERERFSDLIDATLRACVEHLRETARRWNSHDPASGRVLAEARRRAALSATNAEAAFESMLAATTEPTALFEARMTMLTYARRLLVSDVALSTIRRLTAVGEARPLIERLAAIAERALSSSTGEVETPAIERDLAALLVDARGVPPLERQLERIARQLLMLRRAALRLRDGVMQAS